MAARADRSRGSLKLAQLEDAMHVLGMSSSTRLRGRKPKGYTTLNTVDDVRRFLLDMD
jgi:hypothetical protein